MNEPYKANDIQTLEFLKTRTRDRFYYLLFSIVSFISMTHQLLN